MGYPSEEEIAFIKEKTGYDVSPNAMTRAMSWEDSRKIREEIGKAKAEYDKLKAQEKRNALPADLLKKGLDHFLSDYYNKDTTDVESALLIIAGIMLEQKDKEAEEEEN